MLPLVKLVTKLKVICRGNNLLATKVPNYSLSTDQNGVFKRYRAWLSLNIKMKWNGVNFNCCKPITAVPSYSQSIIRKTTLHCFFLLIGYRLCACQLFVYCPPPSFAFGYGRHSRRVLFGQVISPHNISDFLISKKSLAIICVSTNKRIPFTIL